LGVSVDQLPRMRHDIAQRLALIADQSDQITRLDGAAKQSRRAFEALVLDLREKRKDAALRLNQAVMTELPALKLEKASFRVGLQALAPADFGMNGGDSVTFEIKTNPGADWGALNAIASGGELARLALALKAALSLRSEGASTPVMIFDEVDQGVGGAVADAVGMRLKSLSARTQVLVVTHSPQIAALGHHHLKVMKQDSLEGMRTSVIRLDEAQSLEEIARMLSGASITEEARAQALRLKQNSQGACLSDEIKARYDALKKAIKAHRKVYYQDDAPSISDADYDALEAQLKLIEADYPQWVEPDSPLLTVGFAPSEAFAPVTHSVPMLSLDNGFSDADMAEFDTKIRRFLKWPQAEPLTYMCEPKIDGLSCSLVYHNGLLVRAATRGDGRIGEDITDNIRTISEIPQTLKSPFPALIEIRGEVYMTKSDFLTLNQTIEEAESNRGRGVKNLLPILEMPQQVHCANWIVRSQDRVPCDFLPMLLAA